MWLNTHVFGRNEQLTYSYPLSFPVRGDGSLPRSSRRSSTGVSDRFGSGGWATTPAKELWNFRSQELNFRSRERKVHRWNFRSREQIFNGTFAPGSESSMELLFHGTKLPWNFRSQNGKTYNLHASASGWPHGQNTHANFRTLMGYIAQYNKCSLRCEGSEDYSERKKWKSPFSTTPLSFDAPSPANPSEYPHKTFFARN